MSFIEMKCKNCGATLENSYEKKEIRCPYCNSIYKYEQDINEEEKGYLFQKGRIRAIQDEEKIKDKTVRIIIPNTAQLLNKGCIVYSSNGEILAKGKHGDTLQFETNSIIDIKVKMGGWFGSAQTTVKPGKTYKVFLKKTGTIGIREC